MSAQCDRLPKRQVANVAAVLALAVVHSGDVRREMALLREIAVANITHKRTPLQVNGVDVLLQNRLRRCCIIATLADVVAHIFVHGSDVRRERALCRKSASHFSHTNGRSFK